MKSHAATALTGILGKICYPNRNAHTSLIGKVFLRDRTPYAEGRDRRRTIAGIVGDATRTPRRGMVYAAGPIISRILRLSALSANGFVSMSMPWPRKSPRTAAFSA
jgi:hypothetical protein